MMALASLAIQAGSNEYWKVVCTGPEMPASVLVGQHEQDQVSAAAT
jgi:hypothetical protein